MSLAPKQAQALVAAIHAMQEAEDAIFNGRADQYHSDTLHEAAATLSQEFSTIIEAKPEVVKPEDECGIRECTKKRVWKQWCEDHM